MVIFNNNLDPINSRNLNWSTITCKFGFYVQGVFLGSTDPNFINCVARGNLNRIMASGDDDKFINIYNYPCISDNASALSHWYINYYFSGHSDEVSKIVFNSNDTKLISIAREDKSVIIWSIKY